MGLFAVLIVLLLDMTRGEMIHVICEVCLCQHSASSGDVSSVNVPLLDITRGEIMHVIYTVGLCHQRQCIR